MGMFSKLKLSETTIAKVEWDITPDLAFCTFSAKGVRDGLSNTDERICYFFIDNWGEEPRLYLMERGTRFVNILAEVKAPAPLLSACLSKQGAGTPPARGNYPIDGEFRKWLQAEVVEPDDSVYLIPKIADDEMSEDSGDPLPALGDTGFTGENVVLPGEPTLFKEEQLGMLIRKWNFYDAEHNPQGVFPNALADSGDGLTVVDERTGLMWQRAGLDLCSSNKMKRGIEELNKTGFAGYSDWRLPTLEEALSLMEPELNEKGMHLSPCFSKAQPFIFVAARRQPTGYWFVDYARGSAYWSSGTVPGGFARLCRPFVR